MAGPDHQALESYAYFAAQQAGVDPDAFISAADGQGLFDPTGAVDPYAAIDAALQTFAVNPNNAGAAQPTAAAPAASDNSTAATDQSAAPDLGPGTTDRSDPGYPGNAPAITPAAPTGADPTMRPSGPNAGPTPAPSTVYTVDPNNPLTKVPSFGGPADKPAGPIPVLFPTPPNSAPPPAAPPPAGAPDTSSRANFVRSLLPIAKAWQAKSGIPAELMLAMNLNETGGDPVNNILFGVTGPGSVQKTWGVGPNGERVNQTRSFKSYDSPDAAYADFVNLVTTAPRYAPIYQRAVQSGDWSHFAADLQRAGYAEDTHWGPQVSALTGDVQRILTGTSTAGSSTPNADQMDPALNRGTKPPIDSPGPWTLPAVTTASVLTGNAARDKAAASVQQQNTPSRSSALDVLTGALPTRATVGPNGEPAAPEIDPVTGAPIGIHPFGSGNPAGMTPVEAGYYYPFLRDPQFAGYNTLSALGMNPNNANPWNPYIEGLIPDLYKSQAIRNGLDPTLSSQDAGVREAQGVQDLLRQGRLSAFDNPTTGLQQLLGVQNAQSGPQSALAQLLKTDPSGSLESVVDPFLSPMLRPYLQKALQQQLLQYQQQVGSNSGQSPLDYLTRGWLPAPAA